MSKEFPDSTRESFTTDPHGYVVRGNKTVRARAIEFIETLQIQQVKEMPVEEAKNLFQLMIDVWDDKSLKRYFGTPAHREIQKINERKQYLSGTVVQATIELSHDIKSKEGYLEKLGLVHYELRGKTVFMVLENAPLVPELMKSSSKPNHNFSLPLKVLSHKGRGAGGKPICEGLPQIVTERKEREYSGPERNRSSESERLRARPGLVEALRDRGLVTRVESLTNPRGERMNE